MSPCIQGSPDSVLVRYMYDGGVLAQGRLCELQPRPGTDSVSAAEVLRVLQDDGVNLDKFFACAYEMEKSAGGWMPILTEREGQEEGVRFPLGPVATGSSLARRIDVKLFRRRSTAMGGWCVDAAQADAAAQPAGKIKRSGYYGIGVLGAKNQANLGTLWRSAYQLGAAFMFVVGGRYKSQPTDTVHAVSRVPLFEMNDWNAFVEFAPRGARWVAVEHGGTPLEDFEHPRDAIYILGSEDAGLPVSVLRSCHEVVTLSSERYSSFNVAVAGSIIAYDRLAKQRAREAKEQHVGKGIKWQGRRGRDSVARRDGVGELGE